MRRLFQHRPRRVIRRHHSSDAQAAVPCSKRPFDSRRRMLLHWPFDILREWKGANVCFLVWWTYVDALSV